MGAEATATLSSITLICVIIIALVKGHTMEFVESRVKTHDINRHRLHDILESFTPDLTHMYWIGDVMIAGLIVFTITYLPLRGYHVTMWRIICASAVAFVLKLVMSSVTILPDPSGRCKEKEGDLRKHVFGRCNELMPSGHMLVAFVVLYFTPGALSKRLWYAVFCYTLVLWFITLSARNHYTIDTFVSLFVVGSIAPFIKEL